MRGMGRADGLSTLFRKSSLTLTSTSRCALAVLSGSHFVFNSEDPEEAATSLKLSRVTVHTGTMTHTLLLQLFILTASLRLLVSLGSDLNGVTQYEVIRPVRLHTVRKRHAEHFRPETIKYGMKVGGKDIEMHLEKNNELFTRDYSETYYLEDGRQTTRAPDIDHCYYHGTIVNHSESAVSISTCDGLRGYFKTSAQSYLIEPLSGEDEGDHAVFKYDEHKNKPMVCGVTNTTWSSDFEPPTRRRRSRSSVPSIFQHQKYIELYLVADNREYLKCSWDQTKLRKRIFEVVSFVSMVYKPLNTFVSLVGLDVWSSRDLISVSSSADASLDAFINWRKTELVKRTKHDIAYLISATDFGEKTVGVSFIGTACSSRSAGVVRDHDTATALGATLAHEMGHSLGMHHDSSDCVCSAGSCIMAASLSWDIPRSFSYCSSNDYEQYLTSLSPICLLNKPDYNYTVAPADFLEGGEECNCGSLKVCNHRSECQCEPGWKPPHCDTEDGSGLSTEAIAGISAVTVLLVLGAIAGTVGYIWKKRQGPGLPTLWNQHLQPQV
ncbi:disintegrin and metalloproteinase domain-containing protein 28 isoform X2 [Myripristis murdjan]|uniref:disintegrin and metalloproteinase domain-containing protein 28 isoform X2 n=1 Tax=Myripristis murdjan TaxID=586833 RepID=UPI001175DC7A|nr:snake venom metalloproteinase BjussuMP-2-like isoform X2 [Myripristis murdjan]